MGKHLLIMLACCLVPLALILAVSIFGLSLGALTPLIPYALALMCPLMMIFMMKGMLQGSGSEHAHHHTAAPPAPNAPIAETRPGGIASAAPQGQDQCH